MTSRLINHFAKVDANRTRATARRVSLGASSLSVGLLSLGLAVGVMTPLIGLIAPTEVVAQEGDADYSQFYDELEEYGRWIDHPRWGYVWLPNADDGTWRPYTIGNWVNTEEHGWYWNSDEPWGWATYHYGRWVREDEDGWIWIPGREWAPAWVAWREGDQYIGWAPLPPEAEWEAGRGELRFSSSYYNNPSFDPLWIFIRPRHMVSARLHRYIIPRSRAPFVLRSTRYVTNYSFVDRRVYNQGIRINLVERGLNRSLPPVRIVSTENHRDHGFRSHGGEHRSSEHRGDNRGGDNRGENRLGPNTGAIVAGVAVGAVALGVLNVFRPKLVPRSEGGPPPAPRNVEPQGSGRGALRGPEGRPVRPTAGVPTATPSPGGSTPGNVTSGVTSGDPAGQPSIMRPPRSTEGRQRPSTSQIQPQTSAPPPSAPAVQRVAPPPPASPPVAQQAAPPPPASPPVVQRAVPPPPASPPVVQQAAPPPPVSPPVVQRAAPPPPASPPPVVQRAAPPPPPPPPVVQRAAPPPPPPPPPQRTVQPPPQQQRPAQAVAQPPRPQPPAGAAPQGQVQGKGDGKGGPKRNPNDPNQPPVR